MATQLISGITGAGKTIYAVYHILSTMLPPLYISPRNKFLMFINQKNKFCIREDMCLSAKMSKYKEPYSAVYTNIPGFKYKKLHRNRRWRGCAKNNDSAGIEAPIRIGQFNVKDFLEFVAFERKIYREAEELGLDDLDRHVYAKILNSEYSKYLHSLIIWDECQYQLGAKVKDSTLKYCTSEELVEFMKYHRHYYITFILATQKVQDINTSIYMSVVEEFPRAVPSLFRGNNKLVYQIWSTSDQRKQNKEQILRFVEFPAKKYYFNYYTSGQKNKASKTVVENLRSKLYMYLAALVVIVVALFYYFSNSNMFKKQEEILDNKEIQNVKTIQQNKQKTETVVVNNSSVEEGDTVLLSFLIVGKYVSSVYKDEKYFVSRDLFDYHFFKYNCEFKFVSNEFKYFKCNKEFLNEFKNEEVKEEKEKGKEDE